MLFIISLQQNLGTKDISGLNRKHTSVWIKNLFTLRTQQTLHKDPIELYKLSEAFC